MVLNFELLIKKQHIHKMNVFGNEKICLKIGVTHKIRKVAWDGLIIFRLDRDINAPMRK